ncbi:MAG: hypothetical protein C7K11_04230 [Candidatus Amulumruptor caecigallinarius]|nr:MAG: hypothetical protein C7K11_04230 [Candidatus Amulumruptor caecigallinarius]
MKKALSNAVFYIGNLGTFKWSEDSAVGKRPGQIISGPMASRSVTTCLFRASYIIKTWADRLLISTIGILRPPMWDKQD